MIISNDELEKLRLKHEDVREIRYTRGKSEHSLVVRKPTFTEYVLFSNHSVNYSENPNEAARYEIDTDYVDIFLRTVTVFPDNLNTNEVPPGIIISACTTAISLHEFEDQNKLRDLYISAVKNSQTILGVLTQRLLMTYGFPIYSELKNLSPESIMQLLVISEIINKDMGMFAKITQLPNIPFDRRGRLDVKSLVGYDISEPQQQQRQLTPTEAKMKERARTYYKSVGVSDERIAEILNERDNANLESSSTQFNFDKDTTKPVDDKINIHEMADQDLSKISYDKYMELKKDGKLMSFEQAQQKALQENKEALARQIAEDRQKYGDKRPNNNTGRNFKGDLDALLQAVRSKVRDIE